MVMRVPPQARLIFVSGARALVMLVARTALMCALTMTIVVKYSDAASAQVFVASVNGDPITDFDLSAQEKLLRVLHQPSDRNAALESLFMDRLKLHEASKYGVDLKDSDINQEIALVAQQMKIAPHALASELEHSGIPSDNIKAHFKAELGFNLVVQAMNKGVEASESEVRAELAKEGGKSAAGTQYTVRQVIFTLPYKLTPAIVNARAHEAEQLRQRFTDCESGVKLALAENDVTVRDPLTRTSKELNDQLRDLLDKTPLGHLTSPSRSSAGLEMIAVCNKKAANDDTAARTAISQKILSAHIAEDAKRRAKELRDRAVIVRR
jgi:peptidyl-prolyl cis-trans isomerase SurA